MTEHDVLPSVKREEKIDNMCHVELVQWIFQSLLRCSCTRCLRGVFVLSNSMAGVDPFQLTAVKAASISCYRENQLTSHGCDLIMAVEICGVWATNGVVPMPILEVIRAPINI